MTKEVIFGLTFEQFGYVWLYFVPSDKCSIPDNLRSERQVLLALGSALPVPVKDLFFDEDGLSATLSFNGFPGSVFVPWEATICIMGGSSPGRPEVSVAWQSAALSANPSPGPAPAKRGSHLKIVKPN